MTNAFDRSALHPNAAEAFNEKGRRLLPLFESRAIRPSPSPAFQTQRDIGPTITDKDIIGEPIMLWTDIRGRTLGRYFVRDGREIALRDENYLELRKLAEQLIKSKPFNNGIGFNFMEEQIFLWLRAARTGSSDVMLCDHLLDRCEAAVSLHSVAVPIASIEVECAFMLGKVLIRPFDVQQLERMKTRLVQCRPDDQAAIEMAEMQFRKLRKQLAGSTVMEVSIFGEKRFVEAEALRIADEIAAVLRFLSPAAAVSNLAFPCQPLGGEYKPSTRIFHLANGEIERLTTSMRQDGMPHWGLRQADLKERMDAGLRNVVAFFSDRPLTDHERRVKGAFLSYSRGLASYDPNERLIYAMFALEHLLLKDASEPIQQNVGERIAFLIAHAPDDRKAIVANFKKAYKLRSSYVHHLTSVDDEETLQTFYTNAFVFFCVVLGSMPSHADHASFLEHIDNRKFS